MPTLREFFTSEAADGVRQLRSAVQRLDGGAGEAAELQRYSRALRGSAQIAREERVYRVALALEAAVRQVVSGQLSWGEDVSSKVSRTLEDIESLAAGTEAPDDADARVQRSLDRWRELGVPLSNDEGVTNRVQQLSETSRQFRRFAVHEIAGIVAEMDVGLEMLSADPRNRDPLKSILRRERALLGAARLDEIAVVAEALRATEDMTRIIAKLNVPVKEEWLAVFRCSREVLKTGHEALEKGEIPGPSPALSQLRVLRQELLDRYGEVAGAGAPVTPSPPVAPAPVTPSPDDVVPIQQLLYTKDGALKRALELKPQLEQLAETNSDVRESLEEVFDLIRLGIA
jgi:chemotaxis protein histidine kinase CheA